MILFIPFKENSQRFYNKNFKLFQYTYNYLLNVKFDLSKVYVITDSSVVIEFVKKYGIKTIDEENAKDIKNRNEVIACYNAAKSLDISEFIWLPLTQPLRNYNLISLIENEFNRKEENDFDFVTSFEYVSDRSLFYLKQYEDKFLHNRQPGISRQGRSCQEVRMLDGAIYGVKTNFLERIMNDEQNVLTNFWQGKFKTILNDVPFFVDIDTQDDFEAFKNLKIA